ncbi:uncharacterized protein LOC116202233 [Punica granatum]|nr:uncharacterized protein LOC116202233 [Punica granatum]OWM83315.1 hypothetical protein CDL15_Pgr012796 [Punica granatum]
MMSYYCGCRNLKMLMSVGFVLLFFFLAGSPATAKEGVEHEQALFELTSREDMLQMAGYGEEKLSTVLLTGSVLCKACLHGESQLLSWPLSGAVVAVNCRTHEKDLNSNSTQGITDEYGDFMIDLPSHLHAIPKLEKKCTVKLLRVPKNSPCRPAYVRKQKGLRLSSFGNGIRTYDAGDMELDHSKGKPTEACVKREHGNTYLNY